MKKTFIPLFVGLLCWTSAQAATLTYSYDGGKTAAQNGTALQAAINVASAGDELKVQAGTYIGNFSMREGVNVSGGWNEGFTAQTDYASILDAQENGRVLEQPANFTTLTVWSNFTIQNGKLTAASSVPAANLGAGVALGKKGQVKHCLIQNNTFAYNGNCMGGGVGNDAVDVATDVCAEDCWIRNNSGTHGGGVRVRGTVLNCIIENNNTNNSVKKGPAGGVHLQSGRLVNCIVRGNLSGGDTGGVRCFGKSDVINNLIYNNTASGSIGGLSLESALSNVIGNTIVCNNQLTGTGSQAGVKIAYVKDKTPMNPNNTFFVNNVVWGNMSNGTVENTQVYYISRYDKTAGQRSYNAIMGQKGDDSAETSIQLTADDPGFVNAANGDFSLLSTSILLDRGNSAKATVAKDLVGNDRIVNAAVDMGAYEYPIVASDVYVLVGEDLQTKINNTAIGYTVYVQAGTFYGNFKMKNGVNVSGGWDANFENKTDYATILDAQESGRVVNQPEDFTTLTIWENLTIQHGKLTSNLDTYGSGVFLRKKGQVKHCLIQNNTFTYENINCMGGGVANNAVNAATDVQVDECIIQNNSATHGAGVRICGTIQNSIVRNNATTNNAGGGIHLQNGRAVNCQVYGNAATGAAGIRALGNKAEVLNCEVYDNEATGVTGGVALANGACMYNSIIRNNTTSNNVGGVRLTVDDGNDNASTVANCLIANNSATGKIGGVSIESSNGSAKNFHILYGNTIVGNSQESSADANWCGVRQNVGGPVKFCNNIVWGNKVGIVDQESQIMLLTSYAQQTNNFAHNAVVWNGKLSGGEDFEGVNTILLDKDVNPGFTDAANGDYTLVYPSPAGLIDSGHSGYFDGTKDLAGNARKRGTIDRGCYEYTYEAPVALAYTRDVTAGRYGTICLPYAVAAADMEGAKAYKILSFSDNLQSGLLLEEVDDMEAGKPYFFLASAATVSFGYTAQGLPASAGNENGLYGTISGTTVSGEGYYVLQDNELRQTFDGADEIEINLGANRAYVMLSEIPAYTESAPSPRRRVIGIHNATNTTTAIETITNNQSLITGKFIKDGQLIIIRDGKTYNAQGQMVK